MSLLTHPEILRAENQFITLLDRTFQKATKTSTLDYKKELPRNVKRWFGSATFQKQLDSILTSIIVQSLLYADGQMKRLQAASVKESTILTQEAVRLSQELGADVSKSIIRMLDEDAIYYEHPNALAKRIQDLWGGEKYRAVRFARTFTADVATASTVHRYRQYGVRYMEFDAELDDRTTDQCRCLDGVQFDLEKDSVDAYRPPLHFHCRSSLKPITGDDLDESQLFENRDFSTSLDDPDKVDRAFKNIDTFNDKYRVSKYVIDHDLATRVMLDKGMSVGLDVGISGLDVGKLINRDNVMARDAEAVRQNVLKEYGTYSTKKAELTSELEQLTSEDKRIFDEMKRAFEEKSKVEFDSIEYKLIQDKIDKLDLELTNNLEKYKTTSKQIEKLDSKINKKIHDEIYIRPAAEARIIHTDYTYDIVDKEGWSTTKRGLINPTKQQTKKEQDAINFLSRITSESKYDNAFVVSGGKNNLEIRLIPNGERASATFDGISVTLSNDASVIVHEMGHIIEIKNPDVYKSAIEIRTKLATSDETKKLADIVPNSGYRVDEIAYNGNYPTPYMGKVYQQDATEMVSVSVEMLYKDPAYLAENHPEIFNWILEVLS